MKKIKIELIFLPLLIFISFLQGAYLNLLNSYDYDEKEYIEEMDIRSLLNNIEHSKATLINLENEHKVEGEVLFKGSLKELKEYVKILNNNNLHITGYKIEKSEELRCFLELKGV